MADDILNKWKYEANWSDDEIRGHVCAFIESLQEGPDALDHFLRVKHYEEQLAAANCDEDCLDVLIKELHEQDANRINHEGRESQLDYLLTMYSEDFVEEVVNSQVNPVTTEDDETDEDDSLTI